MERINLLALRDLAIEHLPRAQKVRDSSKSMNEERYHYALVRTTLNLDSGSLAKETAAADLLRSTLQLLIDVPKEERPTAKQRQQIEAIVIAAANTLGTLINSPIPWLPATPAEPEPEESTTSTPRVPAKPLPVEGQLLSNKEAAECLGVAEQTLRKWKMKGVLPFDPIKVGRLTKWHATDILRLMREGWKPTRATR